MVLMSFFISWVIVSRVWDVIVERIVNIVFIEFIIVIIIVGRCWDGVFKSWCFSDNWFIWKYGKFRDR